MPTHYLMKPGGPGRPAATALPVCLLPSLTSVRSWPLACSQALEPLAPNVRHSSRPESRFRRKCRGRRWHPVKPRGRASRGVAQETTREPRGHALALGLKMWMVSPRASISTSWAMRLARVSAFTAVCMRHSTA